MDAIHPTVRKALRCGVRTPAKAVLAEWRRRTTLLCKPCWELHYCPYGPVVEDFPLLPVARAEAVEHNDYLKSCVASGKLANGRPLDRARARVFREWIADFHARHYPESLPQVLSDASCRVFGHVCPVFFVAEPLTETKTRRSHSRRIPREAMLKVVRRDGQICQHCGEPVPDDEVEFDHLIPYSKGGRSTVENLRVVHRGCNRRKRDSLADILHPSPIEHLVSLAKERR